MEELSNYKLWLTIFGSLTNLSFVIINRFRNQTIDLPPLKPTDSGFILTLFSYVIVGCFSYIFFYEDIQKSENKLIIIIGLTSYYFVKKILEKYLEQENNHT